MNYVPHQLIDKAFRRLPKKDLKDRLHAMRALANVRGVRYFDDSGRCRTIEIALKPWLLTSRQLYCFHQIAQLLADALLRISHPYRQLSSVREVLHFEPGREAWMRLNVHPRARPLAVIGRLDSTAVYDHAGWQRDFRMLEPNAVGVGGVHYAPTACSVTLDVVGDVLARTFQGHPITATPDPRQLLVDELAAVSRKLNRPIRGIALIENTDYTTGTDEFQELARYLNSRGLRTVVADPRDVRVAGGSLRAKGVPVDFLYRDSELAEFVEMEAQGRPLSGLRHAVRQGRLVSGLTWEFDQKSAWEIFTDSQYSRYFNRQQQLFFRKYVLWTRLVRQAFVSDAKGRRVDLPSFIRRNKDKLVLKPNSLFGGEGVTLGLKVSRPVWEKTLQRALHGRQKYVVQQLAEIPKQTMPRLDGDSVVWHELCVVSGFFFSSSGIGVVGRFSGSPVVNVSQGGGLIPALWVH